ncbi:Ypi1p [Malassezia vespertilionis]|uniref:Type 1 phosphatases regulator n=1 Tax=Malassezia vespertilionis TaxID=2020962 RepID=A0A2N1JFU8_9BASI|nr:Ypi1p [Malassezia vespertilionis]
MQNTQTFDDEARGVSTDAHVGVLRLRGGGDVRFNPRTRRTNQERQVVWTDDTVDNEGMGKKKSKICCIFRKQRAFGESSSGSSASGSDDSDSSSPGLLEFGLSHHVFYPRRATVITTDDDGDPVTAVVTAERTRYDEDDDPTSTSYRTLSTITTNALLSTGTSLTDTDTETETSDSSTSSTSTSTSIIFDAFTIVDEDKQLQHAYQLQLQHYG